MQTQCNTKVEINKVQVRFTGKKITAYGGFSLLAMYFQKVGLREMLQAVIPVTERSPNAIGIYEKVLAYTLMVYAGGNRFSHVLYLGCQEVLERLFGIRKMPSSSSTLTRFFGKLRRQAQVEELSDGLWRHLKGLIPWQQIRQEWLTFDSTVLERYGRQEGVVRGYNPKKKGRGSHHPLLAFLNGSRYVVHLWNRPGNAASWNNILGFFDATWQRLWGLVTVKGVIADSGFYLREFIERLEHLKLTYIIAARLYQPLQRKVYGIAQWSEVSEGISVGELWFQHTGWAKDRRYIAVRQDTGRRPHAMGKELSLFGDTDEAGRYRYSVWITNSDEEAYEVWKQCRPRANDENTIKELKEDFALGGFSLKRFYATEAAMLIRVLLYNLFVLFRQTVLAGQERQQRLGTLRYKYFVIAAQMGSSGRDIILRLAVQGRKARSKLLYLFARIRQGFWAHINNCNAVG
jgi:hypothetical protein